MVTNNHLFKKFVESKDNLWVYVDGNLRFRSTESGIAPLISYIEEFSPCPEGAIVFDRIVGKAAALLLNKASCQKVYSPFASELAIETLERLGIDYSFTTVVPYISNRTGDGMCPFEKASIGKSPDEFYQFVVETFKTGKSPSESSK